MRARWQQMPLTNSARRPARSYPLPMLLPDGTVFGLATVHGTTYVQNRAGDLFSINSATGVLSAQLGTYNTGVDGIVWASTAAAPGPSALPIFARLSCWCRLSLPPPQKMTLLD